jgi:cytochrome c556
MNALGYSKTDQVKYEEFKANRTKIFAEAKPFLDKALTIKPDNASVKAALGNIDSLTK